MRLPRPSPGRRSTCSLGPAGVQWCSKPLLEAVAENSAQTGRRIHMHLLETIYQRAWADQHFPQGIVRYLRDIGFLSERLTLAHCIHARPDEIEMIAASGARIVTNFSSNMHLRSGLAPIAAAHKCGCAIAVGVDGLALDEDDDVLREMRLVQMMHGGLGFKRTWTRPNSSASPFATAARRPVRPGTGELVPGAPADFVTIDLDRLDRDQIMPVDPHRPSICARQCVAAARCGCRRTTRSSAKAVASASIFPRSRQELRGIYRANARQLCAVPARLAAAFGVAAKLVRNATGLRLGNLKSSRIVREFRNAEENSACISKRARFHGQQQETEPAVYPRWLFGHGET